MALFNYATKEITLKIVYYGPGLSGKTTNLQYLHSILNPENKGRLLSLSTEADRTLFFDFLPVELGKIRDFSIRFQLYTVPGQVRYNATRKVVLKGADAVVFVADSQRDMREQNIESFENMRENLLSNNINPDEVPIVLQYNKRDLGNVASVEELNADLNRNQYHVVESSAISGTGVEDSFRLITRLLLKYISKKHQIEIQPSKEKEAVAPLTPAGKMGTSTEELAAGPSVAAAAEPVATTTTPAPAGDIQALWPEEETRRNVPPAVEPPIAIEPVQDARKAQEKIPPPAEEQAPAHWDEAGTKKEEPAEKIVAPAGKNVPGLFFEAASERPLTQRLSEVPAITPEKVDRIVDEISSISGLLTDLKNSVYVLTKELKDLKETRKEREETNRILREIAELFQRLKTKKSWFRF